jgi:peptide/nickel transport system permease protein
MLNFIVKRLFLMIPTLFFVASVSFFLIHITPGDPVDLIAGQKATAEQKAEIRQSLNLDKPVLEQYQIFLTRLTNADLGESLYSTHDNGDRKKVTTMIAERMPNTAILAIVAIIISLIFSIPMAIMAAANKDKVIDRSIISFCILGVSIPSFVLAPILILIFCLQFQLLPVGGNESAISIILPSISLAIGLIAVTTRLLRGSILDNLNKPYVKTAQAKGCSRNRILFTHVLKNAFMPMITIIFLQIGALITGTIFTENIFSWPGVGTLLIDSINRRDYMVAQGCILLIAFIYVLATFLADVVSAYINPQINLNKK